MVRIFIDSDVNTAELPSMPLVLAEAVAAAVGVTWPFFAPTIGAMGAGAPFFIILAFSKAQASLLPPFNYSKLIWVTILGYLVFDDLPGVDTLIGSTIIAAAGLYVLYRERQRSAVAIEGSGTSS